MVTTPHTIDKQVVSRLTSERINQACDMLSNLFDGALNVSEEEVKQTRAFIERLRDVQTDILRLGNK